MPVQRTDAFLISLLDELCKLPAETGWVEFKENKAEPAEIGEYISALSNSAALEGKSLGYLIWGVTDTDHSKVGTSFDPGAAKVGNEELENWLLKSLSPKIHFKFYSLLLVSKRFVILEIERTLRHPVQFQSQEYIRVGSYKKKLKDFPEKERALWRIFDAVPFESTTAAENVSSGDIMSLLDFPSYFELLAKPIPPSMNLLLAELQADNIINSNGAGKWDITNLGAILYARRLDFFGPLKRKAVRVIQYRANDRTETVKEQEGSLGYGSGFERLLSYVHGLLPSSEVIGQALRGAVSTYPDLVVREAVANALVHQDFTVSGAGPMIEIFNDRVEFTNPGEPIVRTDRFVDSPPRSRNEALASLMRRIGICEERGTGWDKIVSLTELNQLPAPLTEVIEGNTRVVLFSYKPLGRMDKSDRVRALFWHACLKWVNREHMTNATVRERFKIEPQNTSVASRLIKEAIEAKMIAPYDVDAATKLMRYVPYWAAPGT